jgi:MGT family glycosyltransferase
MANPPGLKNPTALFFNVPGYGHVNPSLPLVAELARRGHRITYFTTESYRDPVENAGAAVRIYLSIEDDYFDARGLDGGKPQKVAYELLKTTEETLPDLLAAARQADPDYILFDGMCPWGYYVARVLKVPAVASLALMPPISPPPTALLRSPLRQFILSFLLHGIRSGIRANRLSRALGARYGVPPLGPVSLLSAQGDISISFTSKEFQPFSDTVPPSVRFVGREIKIEPPMDPNLFEDVSGRPLIYVSMGTLNNQDRELVELFIGALSGREEYVMLTTGKRFGPERFGPLPDNVSLHTWLPQTAVLKRAALFITHGGLNSIHDGLYFGVPLLVCPQQPEQTFNARRVAALGVGLMISHGKITRETLSAGVNRLLSDETFRERSGALGDTLRAAGGMRKAADEIEALL